jgi:hypothetical protein
MTWAAPSILASDDTGHEGLEFRDHVADLLCRHGMEVALGFSLEKVQESPDPLERPVFAPFEPRPFRESERDSLYVDGAGAAIHDQPRRYVLAVRQHLGLPRPVAPGSL